jgi:phospholipase/lecithinase/hemolysin
MSRLRSVLLQSSAACAVIGYALLTSGPAQTVPVFDHLVVLGDSLSDTGNAGRFSNGPVWVEQLAVELKIALTPSNRGGLNFAVGGARLDRHSGSHNLRAQADLLLSQPQPSGRTLHVVYGGGNDLLAAVGHSDPHRIIETAMQSLRSIVMDLIAHGATDLLMPNLPDIGMTPEIRGRGSKAVEEAAILSDRYNQAVESISQAAARSVRVYRFDIRGLAESVRKDPLAFGFIDIVTPCRGLLRCEGYLFWDGVHPTTGAHARLAASALHVLSTPTDNR